MGGELLKDRYDLVALDPTTGNLELLMRELGGVRIFRHASWEPSMRRGIASESNSLCSTLVWLARDGARYVSIPISEDGRDYVIDASLWGIGRDDCDSQPRADFPAWAPDGRRIAFLFSSEAAGVPGHARLDVSWSLYLMEPEGEPERYLDGITSPANFVWSPDSRWIAFSGSIEREGSGTWLYDPKERDLVRVATAELQWFDWSPDSSRLVGVSGVGGSVKEPKLELIQLDLTQVSEG